MRIKYKERHNNMAKKSIEVIRSTVYCRKDIITMINKLNIKKIAEIGIRDGEHLKQLMSTKPDVIFGIDIWLDDGIFNHNDINLTQMQINDNYKSMLDLQYKNYNLKLLRMYSEEAAEIFTNGYFDMVYIDADHSYEAAKKDVELWFKKTKKNMVLSGHDFHWGTVKKAVNEFVEMRSLKSLFHYTDDGNWFVIKQ